MLDIPLYAALMLGYLLGNFGDYITQSDYMANEKTKKSLAALFHAIVYTIPFVLITLSWKALLIIGVSHFLIDRYRLARYVCWAKNFLAPPKTLLPKEQWYVKTDGDDSDHTGSKEVIKHTVWWYPWSECSKTGYHESRPPWMSVWLMILADNNIHHLINFFTILYLGGIVW